MNSLIILPDECVENNRAVLSNGRARYAFETHEVRAGTTCRVGILGGMRGQGTVVEASPDRVVMDLSLSLRSLDRQPVDLIVGVPRPQTVKKVIQASVMLGVRSLHFVKSELGEKSYLQSKALSEEGILEEAIKALEQVWDSRMPEIKIHRTFSYFLDTKLPLLDEGGGAGRFLAHPSGEQLAVPQRSLVGPEQIIAIGPERGWSECEVRSFQERGFRLVGLGERIVRVEVAVVLLLGQLQLLRA